MFKVAIGAACILLLAGCAIRSQSQADRVYGPASAGAENRISASGQEGGAGPAGPMSAPSPSTPRGTLEKRAGDSGALSSSPDGPAAAGGSGSRLPLKSETLTAQSSGERGKAVSPGGVALAADKGKSASRTVDLQGQGLLNGSGSLEAEKEEGEGDIMEGALGLLHDSDRYWVKGDLENALEALDQAYALILDTDGDPDVARQKDDLRLMISKRILAIYNSVPSHAKGVRSEIPLISNADVEKEIRLFQTVERDFFISSYQRSALYRPIILRELKKAGLPEELSWLPLVESGFKINALSPARALGLWQFIPSTGYKYGLNRDEWVDERMDIEKSTRAAIDYLKELHRMFGDWLTVLAAYNCGEGRVMRTIARQHINYLDRFWDLYQQLPYETARYVPRFLATLLVIKNPQKYGIDLGPVKAQALEYEAVEVRKSVRLQDLAQRLELPEELLSVLNAELRHKTTPDKPYALRVPLDMAKAAIQAVDELPAAERPRAPQAAKQETGVRHRVKKGETLDTLARRYGTSASSIRKANQLGKNERVRAGQWMTIPVKKTTAQRREEAKGAGGVYRVSRGDTLASIAQRHHLTVSELRRANGLKSDRLLVGQTLRLGAPPQEGGGDRDSGEGKASPAAKKAPAAPKTGEKAGAATHQVKKGDTLSGIARENRVSVERLRKLNGLSDRDTITPGQVLQVR